MFSKFTSLSQPKAQEDKYINWTGQRSWSNAKKAYGQKFKKFTNKIKKRKRI